MSDPVCAKCSARGYGNCPMSPPCRPHPSSPRCKKCGASDYNGAVCPEQPHIHANVAGVGWRYVPHRVRDCMRQHESADKLADMIRNAYPAKADDAKWDRFKSWMTRNQGDSHE